MKCFFFPRRDKNHSKKKLENRNEIQNLLIHYTINLPLYITASQHYIAQKIGTKKANYKMNIT